MILEARGKLIYSYHMKGNSMNAICPDDVLDFEFNPTNQAFRLAKNPISINKSANVSLWYGRRPRNPS